MAVHIKLIFQEAKTQVLSIAYHAQHVLHSGVACPHDFQLAQFKGKIRRGHFLYHTDVAQKGHGEGRFTHPGPCGNGAYLPCSQSAGKVVKVLEARGNGFALGVGRKSYEVV